MPSDTARMAWRNLWRNPRRSGLTMAAIAFAALLLVFMLSFQLGTYATLIDAAVGLRTGHLQVQAKGYEERRRMRLVVPDPAMVERILAARPEIVAHAARANAFSLLSSEDRSHGAMVTGIDPEREAALSTLPRLIRQGAYLAPEDVDQALVGRLLARNLKVTVGDEIVVLGQGRDGSVAATALRVKGIFSSGQDAFDRSTLYMPLGYFQEVYFMRGAVHEVAARCADAGQVEKVKGAVAGALDRMEGRELVALSWKEIMPGLMQAIKLDLAGGLIFWGILIIVVAFSILNTFLMAVFERTREFGTLMAIGASPGRIARLLMAESAMMTGIGVCAGIFMGCLVTLYFQKHGIDLGSASEMLRQYGISGRMYPKLTWISALLGPGLVTIITLTTALYPALRVLRLRPVEAMRHV